MFFKKKKERYFVNTVSLFELLKSNNKIKSSSDLKCAFENLDKDLQVIKSDTEEMEKDSKALFGLSSTCSSIAKYVLSNVVKEKADYISDLKLVLFFIVHCHNSVEFWNYVKKLFLNEQNLYAIIYSTLHYLEFEPELDSSFSLGRYIKC